MMSPRIITVRLANSNSLGTSTGTLEIIPHQAIILKTWNSQNGKTAPITKPRLERRRTSIDGAGTHLLYMARSAN